MFHGFPAARRSFVCRSIASPSRPCVPVASTPTDGLSAAKCSHTVHSAACCAEGWRRVRSQRIQ